MKASQSSIPDFHRFLSLRIPMPSMKAKDLRITRKLTYAQDKYFQRKCPVEITVFGYKKNMPVFQQSAVTYARMDLSQEQEAQL